MAQERREPSRCRPSRRSSYQTAYVAEVVADPPGDDLAPGGGEYVLLKNNWDHRTDMGGWSVEDADGNRLPLGIGRQLDPHGSLRVYTGPGDDSDSAIHEGLDHEVWGNDGDVARLLDAGGKEVARLAYGDAAGS